MSKYNVHARQQELAQQMLHLAFSREYKREVILAGLVLEGSSGFHRTHAFLTVLLYLLCCSHVYPDS